MTTEFPDLDSDRACVSDAASTAAEATSEDSSAPVARHPSARLYDAVYDLAFPCVAVLAERKNVPLSENNHAPVLRHALHGLPRKKFLQTLKGDYDGVLAALNRSLDVVATAQMIAAFRAVQGKHVLGGEELVAQAEAAVEQSVRSMTSANDRELRITIWPDLAAMSAEYEKRMSSPAPQVERMNVTGAAPHVFITAPAERWERSF